MIVDQLVFIMFVLACWVYLSTSSMVVLADKIFTFGLVYLVLVNLDTYHSLDEPFKFIFGAKDFFVYSLLRVISNSRVLISAYLISAIVNLGILVSLYVMPSEVGKAIYNSYPYLIQFVSALQIMGVYLSDGHDNGNSRRHIFDTSRHSIDGPFSG